jgi:hypothetical protein
MVDESDRVLAVWRTLSFAQLQGADGALRVLLASEEFEEFQIRDRIVVCKLVEEIRLEMARKGWSTSER